MPYSIDRQIIETRRQIEKQNAKLKQLLKLKEERILRLSSAGKKREAQKLIRKDMPTEEILKLLE